jgi:hypothetical protein
MKQLPRIYYSDTQKALMWERWKQGWTLHEIGKLFDRTHSSIHRIIAKQVDSDLLSDHVLRLHCRR